MLFNSVPFLLLVLPTFLLYYLPFMRRYQLHLLIISSFIFYAWSMPWLLMLLVFSLAYARNFLMPVVLAFMLTMVFSPVRRFLDRRGIPSGLSAFLIVGSLVAMLGCGIAGFLDYWLLMPLINHRSLRPKFENNSLYQKSLHIFKKSPFLLLSGAAMSPIPYYPFKFLSIAGNYPLWKYQTALLVGRMPRYFLLALLGKALQVPTWLLVVIFFVLMMLPFAQKLKLPGKKHRQHARRKKQAERDLVMPEYDELIPISEGADSYHTVPNS